MAHPESGSHPLNRLARSTSPYLLQHAANPVDWHEWGPEALALARSRDLPILLSIGYSACHWCHVMAHESFEDPDVAAYVNENFVPIKVDREERPDIDAIYMEAVQTMTGHGGWPLTAFLDTETRPFYCGTYFPPEPRSGLPSFRMVLEAVVSSWGSNRERLEAGAEQISERIRAGSGGEAAAELPGAEELDGAVAALLAQADPVDGGFGGAPKFPPASALELLLTRRGREADRVCELTLDAIAAGGIHDQLGGGFSRYSVDGRWLVPHFEKMLYDNALLARAYLHGWQTLRHDRWRAVCESTLDWMASEMRGPEGGFYSALDADSEGEEGRFYVWDEAEFAAVLSDAGLGADRTAALAAHWGVTAAGNFEGRNILHLPAGLETPFPDGLEAARAALLERRSSRPRPGLDDKRICAWNALAIAAFADAGAVLGRDDYLDIADATAGFVLDEMRSDGRLRRSWKDGSATIAGYLEDHAAMVEALLTLHEARFEWRWFDEARALAEVLLADFEDGERGGFHTTPNDAEALIARRKDFDDHPTPSGNSAAALGLLRLAALTGEGRYRDSAERALRLAGPVATRFPSAFAHMLRALDFALEPVDEVAIVAEPGDPSGAELVATIRSRFRPRTVVAAGPEGSELPELLAGRTAVGGRAAAYVCRRFSCRRPVAAAAELAAELGDVSPPA